MKNEDNADDRDSETERSWGPISSVPGSNFLKIPLGSVPPTIPVSQHHLPRHRSHPRWVSGNLSSTDMLTYSQSLNLNQTAHWGPVIFVRPVKTPLRDVFQDVGPRSWCPQETPKDCLRRHTVDRSPLGVIMDRDTGVHPLGLVQSIKGARSGEGSEVGLVLGVTRTDPDLK